MLGQQATTRRHGRRTGFVFENEALRVFAGLDIVQRFFHRQLGFGSDDFRAGQIFAIFGIV